MAAFNMFQNLVEDIGDAVHSFKAAAHQLEVYLTNTAPNAATNEVKADLAEIATGNGYTGPVDVQNDASRTGAVLTVTAVDLTITASGGAIAQFRYVVLQNTTPTTPLDPLLGWWDYGSALDLASGESLTVDFGASLLTIS